MLIAGDPSGDMLAAEFVQALRARARQQGRALEAFGAGGPHLAAAGVECIADLTQHAVIGLNEAVRHYFQLRRIARRLLALARQRRPEVIVCVDFSGFNRRLAARLRRELRARGAGDWNPRLVQYVSPQVWASRSGRAGQLARDFDLLLTILPFEKAWYAHRVPALRVEFVGHPIADRHPPADLPSEAPAGPPRIVLLPGSRRSELKRHLGLVLEAAARLRAVHPQAAFDLVFAGEAMRDYAATLRPLPEFIRAHTGGLAAVLRGATLALAATGTVTLECAWYGVPTVAFYRTAWLRLGFALGIIKVNHLALPNLLADEVVYPELLQNDATPEKVSAAALELLASPERRQAVRERLRRVAASLGGPGAADRAAAAVLGLLRGS